MAPVCSNCGGGEFVWVNDLRTGSIGRGALSIRSGGELSLGTRICRGCGHADLFLKDPSILRMPHQWRPGEFVPIPARPTPAPPPPPAPPPIAPPTPAPAVAPPAPEAPPVPPPEAPTPLAPEPLPPTEETTPPTLEAAPPAKKPARRRAAKPKPTDETAP